MPVHIQAQPNQIHPAYNPVVYYLTSSLSTNLGFRYIVQLYDSGSNTLYREFKIAPRYPDNYGYVDVSKVVQDRIQSDPPNLNTSTFTWYNGDDKVYNYDIRFGEEYNLSWAFSDYGFATGAWTAFVNSGFVPHGLSIGDQIVVNLTTTYNDCRDALAGYFTVIDIPNSYTVTVNLPFPCSNAVTPGTINYADNRRTRNINQTASLNRKAFDSAYSIADFRNYSQNQIIPSTPPYTASILTNAPTTDYKVKPFQNLVWPFFDNKTNLQQYVWFKTNNGSTYRNTISSTTANLKMVAVGPGNTNPTAIGLAPTWDNVIQTAKWYDVFATQTTDSSSITSETRRIYLDQECCKNEIELLFLDRAGAYSSFAFCLNKFERGTVQKTNYTKEVGELLGSNPFYYDTWDSGLTTFNVETTKEITLNTDWITDGMSVYFEQLLTSPEIYAKLPDDSSNNIWYRCVVQESAFDTQRAKNKKLIRKTITIRLALNQAINV